MIWRTALGTQISLIPSPRMRCSWEWSVFVRKHSQCCWARCVHVAHQSTHSCPLPQLSWKNMVKTVHFLSLRTMLVTESDCRLRMENLFFSPSETQPHPFPPGSFWAFFFDQKRPGKKLGYRPPETIPLIKTIGLLRTQTLRENDGPIGIPIDDDLRQETLLVELFFWKTPFLQCKVTQRLISVLKQHPDEIGLSKCVLEATTIDKQLYAAVSLLPHDAAASPSCAKKIWVDSFKHDPSERSPFWHAFFP